MFKSTLMILFFAAVAWSKQSASPSQTTLVDALDWYAVWFGEIRQPLEPQTCQGELVGSQAIVRCSPLNVVVSIESTESGPCVVTYMNPAVSSQDGTRLLQPSLPQRLGGVSSPTPEITFIAPDGTAKPFGLTVTPSSLPPVDCYEIPKNQRFLRFDLKPRARPFDDELSARARDAAVSFAKQAGADACVFHYPRVKSGDPLVHVYEECAGKLEAIFEFRMNGKQVFDYPSRSYGAPFRSAPRGVEWRVKAVDLWLTR